MTADAQLRATVVAASHSLAAAGLVPGTAGNVSARDGDRIAITATGAVLAELTPKEVVVVDPDGEVLNGTLAPTSELSLHLEAYRATGQGAVVHTHSPMATSLGLVLDELPVVHYQQLDLGGVLRVAPFAVFGTDELAANVRAALEGKLAVLMASHGAVTVGGTVKQAVHHMMLLEWLCTVYWHAQAIGTPRLLTEEQQAAVSEQAARLGYGTTKER